MEQRPKAEPYTKYSQLIFYRGIKQLKGLQGGSVVKNPHANAEDPGSVSWSGRSPGEDGKPLQYSCLGNPTDRGAWQATVHGVANSQTRLSN